MTRRWPGSFSGRAAAILIGLAGLSAPFQLASAAPIAASAPERVIRFGLTADYPPFALRRPDGTLIGADVEAARRAASDLGARAQFVATTWGTLASDFAADRFDVAIGGLTVTPERAALGVFSTPLMEDGKRPLARCAERDRFTTLAAIDRPEVRVLLLRAPELSRLAKTWFTHAVVTVLDGDGAVADALIAGRADVWIGDGVAVDMLARRYSGQLCAAPTAPFTHTTKAWLIRKDPVLVRQIDAEIASALSSGAWQADLQAIH